MIVTHGGQHSTDGGPSLFVLGSFVVACSAKVARLPGPGESLEADAFTVEPGGKGLNLAVGARRLGAWVDGLLAVGDDPFAGLAAPALARAGLPAGMIRAVGGATGSGIGFTDAGGENCLAVHRGANLRLSAAHVRDAAEAIASAGMVLAQFEIGDEPIREAFAIARAAGRATLLNPSPWRPVDPAILADTSILVCNRVEAAAMAQELPGGADDLDGLAQALLARGPGLVVITLGGEGAAAWRAGDAALRRPAVPVEVVDTLGAGDAFAAGLAVALLEGRSLSAALDMASACGALVCTGTGVFDRLPTRAEVARLLGASSLAAMPV